MNQEQKALAIVHHIARENSAGHGITLDHDWWAGLGAGTITFADGSHSHFGDDDGTEDERLSQYVDGLYSLIVREAGLSFAKCLNQEV